LIRASLPATIEVETEVTEESCVLGNPTLIHQVVMNLCVNSGYALSSSGGLLRVGVRQVHLEANDSSCIMPLRPGNYVVISVEDNGPGISSDILERIFDPFFTTKPAGQGSGLGLAVVHGIVTSMDGAVHVYSEPGQGTVMQVYLPAYKEVHAAIEGPASEVQGGREHILLVDDEEMLVEMLSETLRRLGYTVTGLVDPAKAATLFSRQRADFDILVTDQTMPHMVGLELARYVKSLRPELPVLLCTGFSHIVDEEKAQRAGVTRLVYKPLTSREFGQAVRECLDLATAQLP
jgi:two-component system cell cycle sensor histidine kinase/response regulator CckA